MQFDKPTVNLLQTVPTDECLHGLLLLTFCLMVVIIANVLMNLKKLTFLGRLAFLESKKVLGQELFWCVIFPDWAGFSTYTFLSRLLTIIGPVP